MHIPPQRIKENLRRILDRIAEAAVRASRPPDAVKLIAVTKTVSIEEVRVLHQLGIRHFGENRVEAAQNKIEHMHEDISWHMIGTVQRRKTDDIVRLFDMVDSVDRIALAETLEQKCEALNRAALPVLLEVNVSGEDTKHGFCPDETPAAIERINTFSRIQICGLMTMAPFVSDPDKTRPLFAALRELAVRHQLTELSMGMTNDFEAAIQEGTTQVRIGTALFQEV